MNTTTDHLRTIASLLLEKADGMDRICYLEDKIHKLEKTKTSCDELETRLETAMNNADKREEQLRNTCYNQKQEIQKLKFFLEDFKDTEKRHTKMVDKFEKLRPQLAWMTLNDPAVIGIIDKHLANDARIPAIKDLRKIMSERFGNGLNGLKECKEAVDQRQEELKNKKYNCANYQTNDKFHDCP